MRGICRNGRIDESVMSNQEKNRIWEIVAEAEYVEKDLMRNNRDIEL